MVGLYPFIQLAKALAISKEAAILQTYLKSSSEEKSGEGQVVIDLAFTELICVFEGNFTDCWQFVKKEQRKVENASSAIVLLFLLWKIELEARSGAA
jgi:hypothetical protein